MAGVDLREVSKGAKVDIDAITQVHDQKGEWTCAASAHEFVAKLHGLLAIGSFPLQKGPDAEKGGWTFNDFLVSIGFTQQPLEKPPADALVILQNEVSEGRFPMVSVDEGWSNGVVVCHILVAVPTENGVGLVDPAKQSFRTQDDAATLQELERSAKVIPRVSQLNTYTPIVKASA